MNPDAHNDAAERPDEGRRDEGLPELLATMLDGELSEAQEARLHEIIRTDAAARRHYIGHCCIHAVLPRELRNPWPNRAAPRVVPRAAAPRLNVVRRAARACTANALALGGALAFGGLLSLAASIVLFVAATRAQRSTGVPPVFQSTGGTPVLPTAMQDRSPANHAAAVAQLLQTADCTWGKGAEPPNADRELVVGQELRLESGLVELSYRKGVNMVLQGPARLALGADNQVYLHEGRLTARLTDEKLRGFTVRTARTTVVDEGTEFGVDVAPGGDQNIHVFQGEVKLNVSSPPLRAGETWKSLVNSQSLKQDQAARVNAATDGVTLIKETGESFTRSIEHSGHNPHVVAYWRFEDHAVGMLVPDTAHSTAHVRGTIDSSGNGNDLFTWSAGTAPRFSGDVPADTIRQSGKPNATCLDNSAPPDQALTRDLYTESWFSHASPVDIQQITPERWTVECSIKPNQLGRRPGEPPGLAHPGPQTFVGRDVNSPLKAAHAPQRLSFQINADGHFAIRFFDKDDRVHEAVASRLSLMENQWYHLAAVSDGKELRLYVDALDGQGYLIQAVDTLPRFGSTALGKGNDGGQWSVGRGRDLPGAPAEWFCGWIDEVRISDTAYAPAEFLFADRLAGSKESATAGR